MAHFAEIDENNVVLRVLVVDNEQEHRGQEFLAEDLGLGGRWIQTSYHGNIRKMYAGIGYIYNEELDIFIPPKPYESWIFNNELEQWEPTIGMPIYEEGKAYLWNEDTQSWDVEDLPKIILDQNNI
jgi:hypothetical protein